MRAATQLRDLVRLDGSVLQLLTLAVEALPRLPSELFSVANRYMFAQGRLVPGELATRGAQSFEKLASAFSAIMDAPPEFLGVENALTSTTKADSWNESAAEASRIAECQDFVGTVIQVGHGRFAMAGAGVAERMPTPRYELRSYRAINTLLANNLRVRDALGGASPLEQGDGVYELDGSMVEGRETALQSRTVRRTLAELIRRREDIDAFDPLDDAEALVRWNDLARGSYVLLDHVDTDRRRYVVCFRVDVKHSSPFALSRVEQHVIERILLGARNKAVASELDISSPHVSGIAQRALRKLGVSSLSQLSRVLHSQKPLVLGDVPVGSEVLLALGYEESTAALLDTLTSAERGVARALMDGLSHREIALERGVAARTVASQVASIYKKLSVSGRRELTAKVSRGH
jgi:DNA-binding NarL/FixJ family response regulator